VISRQFNVTNGRFEELRLWLAACRAQLNANEQQGWQLELVLEEFFANTVNHGYPATREAPADHPVWVSLAPGAAGIDVVYEDAAFEYNPIASIQAPDYSGPEDTWKIGGLGLPMIANIARDLRYERVNGRNRIALTLPTE
jgi:anti-sigma regulatory factor (Ser/Thr protein kinase)